MPLLVGPTAIAFVEGDAVTRGQGPARLRPTNPNLVVKGGLLGDGLLTAKEATALADIPPREVLLARLAGGLAAPLQQFAGLLQALPRNFAYGLSALIEKQGGVPEAAAEPEPAPAEEPHAPKQPRRRQPKRQPPSRAPRPPPRHRQQSRSRAAAAAAEAAAADEQPSPQHPKQTRPVRDTAGE